MLIPYGKQNISKEDISNVIDVLKSEYLTQGPVVNEFAKSITEKVNSSYAIPVNSATSALHIAYKALDLKEGDYLWSSPNTFAATTNAALSCGATVDFIDINRRTYNLCVDLLERKLSSAKVNNTLPKIISCVHYAGQSCEMKQIYKLSLEYGFRIVEDASHAIGAKYLGEYIGSCKYSDITVFSFHPVKIITTGEGGVAVTNDMALAEKMSLMSSHGIKRNNNDKDIYKEDEIWNYSQVNLGFNYRITDIQAALGLSQMKKLDEFVEARHSIAKRYINALSELPIILPHQDRSTYSSYHLFPIRILIEQSGKTQKTVYRFLREKGILVNIHYIPVYRHPYYKELGFSKGYCKEAESYYRETISLPIFPGLSRIDFEYIVNSLNEAFQVYV